jgi:hypothetical protein
MRKKLATLAVLSLALAVGATAVAAAASPEPDLRPDFILELMKEPTDVTNLAADRLAPSRTSREDALQRAREVFSNPNARYRIFRAASRKYVTSIDRDVWVVVFEGGNPFFGGPGRSSVEPPVVKLTGIIIDAETGEFLRGFMEAAE